MTIDPISADEKVVAMPQRPINIVMPLQDEAYRKSLRERAHQLAPILWQLPLQKPDCTWTEALQDPRLQNAMALCIATAEMCIRLVDCINTKLGMDSR